ncbi:hypothetical protein EZV73_07265 [Acidaminobacter sp. JC074]|uniref:hypothetical protein n=1 Tax=Acidaminobacter sp. JC074 TaxID=2530199 RepID=UPI001F0D573C|nr:hypothetical protein [Acidaminobacter sp. JC074]MCH4887364.1 hypothetical protein [Acidaminobacter sp. JC074]
MSEANNLAKVQQLSKIAKENPKDIEFIRDHLTLRNRQIFDSILKEKKVKAKKAHRVKASKSVKPMMVTVMNEARLAAELSVALAKNNKNKTIAILDADRFNPKLNTYLNAKSYIKSVYTHLDFQRTTGLNLLIDASHKHVLTKKYAQHLSLRVKGYKNIHYFSGSYMLEDYEYYKLEDFRQIIKFLKSTYDLVIVHTNDFIYDAFTVHSLIGSDVNLIPCKGLMHDVKEKTKCMTFLEKKQRVTSDKNIYVLFNHDKKRHINKRLLNQAMDEKFLSISYLKQRDVDSSQYNLTRHMKKRVLKEYSQLMKSIDQVIS